MSQKYNQHFVLKIDNVEWNRYEQKYANDLRRLNETDFLINTLHTGRLQLLLKMSMPSIFKNPVISEDLETKNIKTQGRKERMLCFKAKSPNRFESYFCFDFFMKAYRRIV